MRQFDWIIIGGGITGAALGYELTSKGLSVLLLEQNSTAENATRYSYGGLAYWSGISPLTRQLSQEGINIHRHLSTELDSPTEFRELDLLLTINPDTNPQEIAQNYTENFAIPPQLLDPQQACELEPQLNPEAIAGVLRLPHGHINPPKTTQAYLQAMERQGGKVEIEAVVDLIHTGERIEGVRTPKNTYKAENTVICAGGFSRSFLNSVGITVPVYFTHAEVIETPPLPLELQSLIMPADNQRFALEDKATQANTKPLWDEPNNELFPPVLDPGAIQFQDGHIIIGQWSRVLTNPHEVVNSVASETALRKQIGKILPSLQDLPGKWHSCLVAFSQNPLPHLGNIKPFTGLHLFSGFTSTLLFAPPLAKHFVAWSVGENDTVMANLIKK